MLDGKQENKNSTSNWKLDILMVLP
uniref:Uncharacterized protein n=1 Tax=Rhizophora mucronata TaxID=61149 RepID=A0A2P2NCQ9_RHIMU